MQPLQLAEIDDSDEQHDLPDMRIHHQQQAALRSSAGWVSRALNSTICCGCLLLLSPAIVAVWIAIRRSAQPVATSATRSRATPPLTPAASPMRIVLKPDRIRFADPSRLNSLNEPQLAAQAAV